jgi:hypothetical protein
MLPILLSMMGTSELELGQVGMKAPLPLRPTMI